MYPTRLGIVIGPINEHNLSSLASNGIIWEEALDAHCRDSFQ